MHEQHEGVAEVMGMERSREKGTRGPGGPRVFLVILICLKHSYSTESLGGRDIYSLLAQARDCVHK